MVKGLAKEKLDARVLNKIKKTIEEKGIRPVQLARKLGYSSTWSSLLMSGDRGLTVNQLIRIAEILNVNPSSLLPNISKKPDFKLEDYIKFIVEEEIKKQLKK